MAAVLDAAASARDAVDGAAPTAGGGRRAPVVIGERRLRVEDARLLTGRGRYLADHDVPGLCHVAFVRSPVAHARIRAIETAARSASPAWWRW